MLPGAYARLENISESGQFLADEQFVQGGKTVTRKAGSSAGNIMAGWRRLRQQEPELFQHLLVWQSPTAFADSVIFSWMQQEESSRFECMLRLVDSLGTHWTEKAQDRNFLCQALQACVPPGCTPLAQPTDTGFAMPAKAAARQEHDRQRSMLRERAKAEGVGARYKVGCREVLQTAQVMQRRMEELNEQRQTVLAEARACGWLHWRPSIKAGRLLLAADQPWARPLTEGSSRMGPSFRENRESWVEDGVPRPVEKGRALEDSQPVCTEKDYFDSPDALSPRRDRVRAIRREDPGRSSHVAPQREDKGAAEAGGARLGHTPGSPAARQEDFREQHREGSEVESGRGQKAGRSKAQRDASRLA